MIAKNKYFARILYVLFLFVVAEVTIRIFLFKYCAPDSDIINCASCWRIRWARESAPKHKTTPYLHYRHDKTKGWNVKPNYSQLRGDNRDSSPWAFTTNSKGLRAKKEHSYEKPRGRRRILIIGDSFAFGEDASDDEIVSYFLGEMLPDTDVLNLGVSGYGLDQTLLRLKEEGVRYEPDIVILIFTSDEVERNVTTFRDYAKTRYVLKNNKLLLKNVPVPSPEEMIRKERFRLYFLDFLDILVYATKEKMGLIEKEENEISKALIHEMNNVCKRANAKFLILYADNHPVLEDISKEGIVVKYVGPDTHSDAFMKAHWDPVKSRFVAERLSKFLIEK